MRFRSVFFLLFYISFIVVQAQQRVVFNKTEHDFGRLAPTDVAFEQDFLLRNTQDYPLQLLTVRSVSRVVSFVYTRSEILKGEYGFIKIRLRTDSIHGLLHEEVYITMKQGSDILSEVLYIRANVSADGAKDNKRKFQDSHIATSVEVSPSDIAGMEGFLKEDKLVQASAEIAHLKKQVLLKSDLIARLSDDLRYKQQLENENLEKLSALESVIRTSGSTSKEEALRQIAELSRRSLEVQQTVSKLQGAIQTQEDEFARMKHEADSARNYAQGLSSKLEEQFKVQAAASERADRLERDLATKLSYEARQKSRIDSLQAVLSSGRRDEDLARKEIEQLSTELAWRKRGQEVQQAFDVQQRQKIEALNRERTDLAQRADSLHRFLTNSNAQNVVLQKRLESSVGRIHSFEREIDSLNTVLGSSSHGGSTTSAELDSLKQALAGMEAHDRQLKVNLSLRDEDMRRLSSQKLEAENNLRALETATARQVEEARALMGRVNQLNEREAAARAESQGLRRALAESTKAESEARLQVANLAASIAEKDLSVKALSDNLHHRELEMTELNRKQQELERQHRVAEARLQGSSHRIDSLNALALQAQLSKARLEKEIVAMQLQIVDSKGREQVYRSNATDLESRLQNAQMSGELTFSELKGDMRAIADERDQYKELSSRLQRENEQLKTQLQFVTGDVKKAGSTPMAEPTGLVYRVNVHSSDKPYKKTSELRQLGPVHEYTEAGKYRYAIGEVSSLSEALKLKDQMKARGYDSAYVVVFREGRKISLKEAIELADSGKG